MPSVTPAKLAKPAALTALVSALMLAAGPAAALIGGTNTTAFKQVGGVTSFTNGSNVQFADNWVLTAHHVAFALGAPYSNGYGSSTIAARYDFSSAAFPENDLTLLRLSSAVAAPQLSLLSDEIAPSNSLNMDATLVTGHTQVPRGYGFAAITTETTLFDPDGATGALPAVPVNWLLTFGSASSDGVYVQPGDSGGALFLGHVTDSSSSPLMGITSAALTYTDTLGTHHGSAFVQLASYRSWIDSVMLADTADSQTALWISAVPEPTSTALMLVGLVAMLGLKQRRCQAPNA